MFETHEALRMFAGLDPQQLTKALRHLRHAADEALGNRSGSDVAGPFRLDDLVPIADVFTFFAEEMDWSRLRDLDPAEWARQRGGAR